MYTAEIIVKNGEKEKTHSASFLTYEQAVFAFEMAIRFGGTEKMLLEFVKMKQAMNIKEKLRDYDAFEVKVSEKDWAKINMIEEE